MEQIGPIARTVKACAVLFEIIAGYDPADSTSLDTPVPRCASSLADDIAGVKIGVPIDFFGEGVDPAVENATRDAINVLEDLGARATETSMPSLKYALSAYYIQAMSEASSNLARYCGIIYGYRGQRDHDWHRTFSENRASGFGKEVKRRVLLGTYALSAGYYDKDHRKRLRRGRSLAPTFRKLFSNTMRLSHQRCHSLHLRSERKSKTHCHYTRWILTPFRSILRTYPRFLFHVGEKDVCLLVCKSLVIDLKKRCCSILHGSLSATPNSTKILSDGVARAFFHKQALAPVVFKCVLISQPFRKLRVTDSLQLEKVRISQVRLKATKSRFLNQIYVARTIYSSKVQRMADPKDLIRKFEYGEKLKSEVSIANQLLEQLIGLKDDQFVGGLRILEAYLNSLMMEIKLAQNVLGSKLFFHELHANSQKPSDESRSRSGTKQECVSAKRLLT